MAQVAASSALRPRRRLASPRWLLLLAMLLPAALLLAFGAGRIPLEMSEILRFVLAACGLTEFDAQRYALLHNLIIDIRLPRIAAAVLVGAGLCAAGAAFQGVFRNPLVSPDLLGVLAGAALGAALGILLDGSWLLVQGLSFVAGLLAVSLGLAIANLFGIASVITLVLGGIIASALFSSALSVVKYVADPQSQLPVITYWLMGNMGMARMSQLPAMALPVLAGVLLLAALGRALDAMAMGDDEARTLGVPVQGLRYAVIATATLVSAATVSVVGMVGWIGLVVPHIARLLVGPANAVLIPASALLGASFLVLADLCARSFAGIEIPIGIVTQLLGIPVFILVLGRVRRGWS